MVQAIHDFADLDTESVSNSLTLTTRLSLSAAALSAAGFATNDEVIVFAWAILNQANTATEQQWRLLYNGTTVTNATADPRMDCWATSVSTGRMVSAMARVDLGATIGDFAFQNARVGTSANVVVEKARIIVIRLADFGVEGTDWLWNRSTTNVAHTTTYSATNRAAITWTPDEVTDWVAFYQTHIAIDSVSVNAEAELMLDTSTLVAGDWSEEGESTTEEYSYVDFGVIEALSMASHTLDVRTRDDTATAANDHRESAIFVFKVSKWADIFWHLNTDTSVGASGADTQVATITDSISVNQDAVIVGSGVMNQDVLTGGWLWVRQGGSTVIAPVTNDAAGQDKANWAANDASDELPALWMGHAALTAGAQDLDLFAAQSDSSARTLLRPRLLMWGMELADAGLSILKLQPETLETSESVLHPRGLRRVLAETTNQFEAIVRARIMARVQNETTNLSEAIIRARVLVKELAETLTLSESVVNIRGLFRLIGEDLDLSETNLRSIGLTQIISEEILISHANEHHRGMMRIIEESIEQSEQTLTFRSLLRQASELMQVEEADLRTQILVRVIQEDSDLSETIIRLRQLIRQEAENLDLSDTEEHHRGMMRVVAESMNLAETDLFVRGIFRMVLETVELEEDRTFYRGIFHIVEEVLSISEDDLRLMGVVMVVAELLGISEDDLRFQGLIRQVSEVLGLNEGILTARSLTRVQSETESLVEAVLKIQALLRAHNEGTQITETDSWVRGLFKMVVEEIQLAEGFIAKIAAAITGVLAAWRTFVPRNRNLGGDRGYGRGDRVYDPRDRSHEN